MNPTPTTPPTELDTALPAGPPVSLRRRALAVSATVTFVVVLLTAAMWLLWPVPAGPTVLRGGTAHYVVTTTIDSTRVGTTAVEVDLAPRDIPSAPTTLPVIVDVQAVLVGMGYPTPPVQAVAGDSAGYRADAVPLPMPGRWEVHILVHDATGSEDLVLPLVVTG